jgi:serine/threonine protein kinase
MGCCSSSDDDVTSNDNGNEKLLGGKGYGAVDASSHTTRTPTSNGNGNGISVVSPSSTSMLSCKVRRVRSIWDRYERCHFLGEGTSGQVVVGRRRAPTISPSESKKKGSSPTSADDVVPDDVEVAIKVMRKSEKKELKEFTNEANLLARVHSEVSRRSQSIMKLYETIEDDDSICLVTEYCSGGELLDRVNTLDRFSERMASKLFKRIVMGISCMHAHGVVHLDLKPQNIVFGSDGTLVIHMLQS